MKKHSIPNFAVFILILLGLGLGNCQKKTTSGFDPQNEDQLLEVYVKTIFFKDFSVKEKYDLEGKNGAKYTDAIIVLSKDSKKWKKFTQKAEEYRREIEGNYQKEKQPKS